MFKPQGYATITDPETGTRECDTFTCAHCNRVVHLPANKKIEDVGDFCRSCMKMICDKCAGKGCTPFLKQIEMDEARYHALRSYG
jgi:hypothetical protein